MDFFLQYKDIFTNGVQEKSIDQMQTRSELYEMLNYHDYEDKLDRLFADEKMEKDNE